MSLFILITGTCAVFFCMKLFHYLRTKVKEQKKDFIQWGLGVDCCCYYSRPFMVNNECITIVGFQEVVDEQVPIRYSIVKMNWWGKRKVYGEGSIYGNYEDTNSFQMFMENIPNGNDYQIEIFNRFNMSFGQFQVK